MTRAGFRPLLGVAALLLATSCNSSNPASPGPGPAAGQTPITLASLSVASAQVEGGAALQGTATLSGAAPAGGTIVSLASTSPAATVPASITVPAGASSATFAIATTNVAQRTTATILGSSGGANRSATLSILAPGAVPGAEVPLASLQARHDDLIGGDDTSASITLSEPAPSSGVTLRMSSDDAAVEVPGELTIAAGARSGTFAIRTQPVAAARTATITVTASIAGLRTATATLTIQIRLLPEGNELPVATDDSATVDEDAALTVPAPGVLVNDTDADGDPLTAVLVDDVASGVLTLNGDGSFTYTPDADFDGVDTFTYRANDGAANSNVATVTITVTAFNDAPVTAADSYATAEDTVLTVAAPGVLDNDTDADGDTLTAILVEDVDDGALTLNADGSFAFTPAADFTGTVTFTYRASDGTASSNTAIVTFTIGGSNDAPVAADDSATVDEDAALTVPAPGVLGNDTDADGDPLTAVLVDDVASGVLTLNSDGSFIYTPDPDFNGVDTFTYRAHDGTANSNAATVTITITDDAPTVSGIADATIDEDTSSSALAFTVGDGQTAAGSLTVSGSSSDTTLVPNANIVFGGSGANRTVTLTPLANESGSATITITVSDGTDSTNDTFTLTVNAVNDAPGFTAGANQTVDEDSGAQTVNGWATGLSTGPANESGQTVSFAITNNTNAALFSAGPAVDSSGALTYTPAANAAGTATITVRAEDDGGTAHGGVNTSATQQFTITVNQLIDDEVVYDYTGAAQSFAVPDGITRIEVEAFGARGGNANSNLGGAGGSVEATIAVTPGGTLSINVGGAGVVAGGFNGGGGGGSGPPGDGRGGGGASDIRQGGDGLGNRIIVAGGGGGAGGLNGTAGLGGAGGGLVGASGTSVGGGAPGTGGAQAAGGAGGAGSSTTGGCGGGACTAGSPGVSGTGGAGGAGNGGAGTGGGGGGGGFFGGGGGGGSTAPGGGGGGGGSSWVDPTVLIGVATHQQGVRTGNGRVVIRW